jgi:hypothetical protein
MILEVESNKENLNELFLTINEKFKQFDEETGYYDPFNYCQITKGNKLYNTKKWSWRGTEEKNQVDQLEPGNIFWLQTDETLEPDKIMIRII